jgi:hypothetical protein
MRKNKLYLKRWALSLSHAADQFESLDRVAVDEGGQRKRRFLLKTWLEESQLKNCELFYMTKREYGNTGQGTRFFISTSNKDEVMHTKLTLTN